MIEFQLRKTLGSGEGAFTLDSGFRFPLGSILGISGRSGTGKTTLLRCLAGLVKPDSGSICFGEEVWYDGASKVHLPPQLRGIGMVFQDYALFPHLTVLGNLLYARNNRTLALEFLEMVNLADRADFLPRELSGGQKQRAALARALVREPRLLLLDEPLSSLEEDLRTSLGESILKVQRTIKTTTVLVSHSRAELGHLADAVWEMG